MENSGQVDLTVVKKQRDLKFEFGVRTVKDTANPGHDYKDIDEHHSFGTTDDKIVIHVPIVDNNEWEPDLDFLVELYDINTGKRLSGDDTQTRVTILD
tara:strand:+ start:1605 stop:1898 length:294 start_codon:yes stop_codon:yes gene_type:complete